MGFFLPCRELLDGAGCSGRTGSPAGCNQPVLVQNMDQNRVDRL